MEKSKKIRSIVAGCLAAVTLATAGLAVATDGFKSFKKNDNIQMELPEENNGGTVIGESTGNGVKVMSAKIAKEDYVANGISPLAETAYTLTATVLPADTTNKKVDWSIAFKNASSTWASGKTVTDYVTVTPSADGALTAVVACLQPFGEQIKVTVTSQDNAEAKAEVSVDYVKRLTGAGLSIGGNNTVVCSESGTSYIDTDSNANKVQLAVSWTTDSEGNIVPDEYDKFDLRFCSVSEGASYARLFYKFRVVDHVGADGKTIAERVNSNERRYDISGVELVTEGNANATEYTVGGTYLFTGYAKGYGADETAESNLSCSVRNLETIRLDLSGETDGVDKRTYWRSNSSSAGAHHQNQINSVFFAIDKKVLEKYGYTLQRIKAEWWEYKTRPAIVIDDQRIYNELFKWNGVEISEDYDRTRGWILHNSDYYYMNPLSRYQWSWNAQIQDNPNNVVTSEDIDTLLPLLFYTGGVDVNDYVLLPETLQTYFETYNKSYVNGHLQFNNKDYSADLFDDSVDEGRTRGYNLREFDISNPDDFWDIHSYDDTHNWWDKLWDYGFGSITTDDSYRDIKPIEMVTPELMAQSDLANTLFINPDDVETFMDYYNSVKDDCEVFLFRYAVTDYWAEDLSVFEINSGEYGTHHDGVGELRQGTQFFDFDILEFTFNKEGVYTVIPVVSSPIDHISGYTPSVEPDDLDWWKILLAVLALIVLLIIFMPILPYVIKAIVWVILLPFKLIGWIFKSISDAVKKRKQ